MTTETVDLARMAAALEALRAEVAQLSHRVAALEAAGPGSRAAPAPQPALAAEGLGEEVILVISAAVAAFLGKKTHVRQVRLLDSAAWAQQGRVTIQASHRLAHAP